jgi:hypothetical protein
MPGRETVAEVKAERDRLRRVIKDFVGHPSLALRRGCPFCDALRAAARLGGKGRTRCGL